MMKLSLILVALAVASVSADVSHLSNEYLPPHGSAVHHHAESSYAEQTNEIPQVIGANTYTPEHLLEHYEEQQQQHTDAIDQTETKVENSFIVSNQLEQEPQQAQVEFSAAEQSAQAEQSSNIEEVQTQTFGSQITDEQFEKVQPFMASAELINEMAEAVQESALPIEPAIRAPEQQQTYEESHGSDTLIHQTFAGFEQDGTPLLMHPGIFVPEASTHQEDSSATNQATYEEAFQPLVEQQESHHEEAQQQASQQEFQEHTEHHHHGHLSESGIDTQYGSNGGYIY